jgi:hypothetical protein
MYRRRLRRSRLKRVRHETDASPLPALSAEPIGRPGSTQRPVVSVCTHTPEYFCQKCSPIGRRPHLEAVRAGRLAGYKPHAKLVLVSRDEMGKFLVGRRVTPRDAVGDEASHFLRTRGLK